MKPLQIGRLRVENPVFLAPMAGYTDAAFRSVCLDLGCGGAVTEMVNAYGLTIDHRRTGFYLERWDNEEGAAVGAQIYGSDPATMAAAAAKIAEGSGFAFLDINAGCPMPKIRNRGDGAGLMRTPERLAEIVRAVKGAVGELPVTVKTRVGWDVDHLNAMETTAGVEEAGADAIFLHGRVALVRHSGPSDWGLIAEVKAARRIPVIGNGGVNRAADAAEMLKQTGVDGVMVGRGAIGKPWIFRDIALLAAGKKAYGAGAPEIRKILREHLRREIELMRRRGPKALKYDPETTACLVMRPHIVRYLHGYRGLREFASHLNERQTPEELLERVDRVLDSGLRRNPAPEAGGEGP
jgi:tRNA-dihydrouridine synthase B